jgi:hypothetical protein
MPKIRADKVTRDETTLNTLKNIESNARVAIQLYESLYDDVTGVHGEYRGPLFALNEIKIMARGLITDLT